MKLLAWQFAEEGRKALRFDRVFTVLGINMDLSQSRVGRVLTGNKPERVQSLTTAFATRVVLNEVKLLLCMDSEHSLCNR